ncbi:MFS transporter [Haloplanus halophilus]|uniref:MFS transporter n=1 Tax=Haloplanus halophilus TaxID=2949993 RepID=UPI00203E17AE|nr:MFS transporter [Haloplanus sp. GDY1]
MSGVDGDRGLALVPWRSSTLYVVLSCSLMGVMGVSLVSPVLPDLRPVFGVSDAAVGLVITAYTLPGVVVTPFVGLVADRFGRRRVVIPLLFLFAAAGTGVAFARTFAEVLALRLLQGVGASALITLAVTLIGDVYDGRRRDAVMGLNGSTIGTGAAFYPLLGGALAGIRWSAPFLFFGVAALVGVFAAAVLTEPDAERSTDLRAYLGRLRAVAVLPRALAIFAALFLAFFIFYGAVLTVLPLLLSDAYGLGAGRIGATLSAVALASAAVSSGYGRLSGRRSASELVALGFVAYGVGLLAVRLSPSPLAVGASLAVFGVGFGVVMPSIDTAVVTLVDDDLRAGVMGMRTSVLRLGQTLGPVGFTATAGLAFDSPLAGYRFLLAVTGLGAALAGGAVYLLLRR